MMLVYGILALFAVVQGGQHHHPSTTTTTTAKPKTDHELIQDLLKDNAVLKKNVDDLVRQVMLQQTFVEERIRSDGSSGLKQVRNTKDGTRPYYTATAVGRGIAGVHEHANNIRTVGMGELNFVLNGVEFRTRHNDYRLRSPVTNDTTYNKLVDIPYPDVPPEVLAKPTVAEQVAEMKEWFKAFKTQDHSTRDYRKYFKPVMCYMEGGWTTNTQTLEEPFFSDRHFIDASSWFDLQDKIRFTSYSGGKSNLENFAYLPTTIMNIVNGTPEYAQWNYRIACHQLKDDLPTSVFKLEDDLPARMRSKISMASLNNTRMARFSLKYRVPHGHNDKYDRSYSWGLLDNLMYQVPGKNNYGANIDDNALGLELYDIRSRQQPFTKINVANYHRWYKVIEKDAMGTKNIHRGFSDPYVFAAMTTSSHISPLSVKTCKTHRHRQECHTVSERFTWAVPLEIIYLTPLLNWNPYDLQHTHASSGSAVAHVMHGPNGTRNGALDPDHAYNGTHDKLYYRTPVELFSDDSGGPAVDRADTAKGVVGVLDKKGVVRKTVASGTRIVLPNIPGVGKVRMRYPIMPLHAEGSTTRKELEALKDMVMDMPRYSPLFENVPTTVSKANSLYNEQEHLLKVAPTTQDPPGLHSHDIVIHQYDIDEMKKGHITKGVLTSLDNGHQHSVDISMDSHGNYIIVSCDGMHKCWDGHDNQLIFDH